MKILRVGGCGASLVAGFYCLGVLWVCGVFLFVFFLTGFYEESGFLIRSFYLLTHITVNNTPQKTWKDAILSACSFRL